MTANSPAPTVHIPFAPQFPVIPPTNDGILLETPEHRLAMNLLLEQIEVHWDGRRDFFAGGSMLLYYCVQQIEKKNYRGPDVFVTCDIDKDKPRSRWVVWEEDGRYPDLIVELTSSATVADDRGAKKKLYEQVFRTHEYYIYDPHTQERCGWRRCDDLYEPIRPDEYGRLSSDILNLTLGPWPGEYQNLARTWPRWFQPNGPVVPTFAERATQSVVAERRRAERAEAKLADLRNRLAALLAAQPTD